MREVIREEVLEKRTEVKGPNTLRLLSNDPAANYIFNDLTQSDGTVLVPMNN